jgi:hypothetical protein
MNINGNRESVSYDNPPQTLQYTNLVSNDIRYYELKNSSIGLNIKHAGFEGYDDVKEKKMNPNPYSTPYRNKIGGFYGFHSNLHLNEFISDNPTIKEICSCPLEPPHELVDNLNIVVHKMRPHAHRHKRRPPAHRRIRGYLAGIIGVYNTRK